MQDLLTPFLGFVALGFIAVTAAIATAAPTVVAVYEAEGDEHRDQEQQRNEVFAHV